MSFTNQTAIPYGLLVMYAMDIYRQRTCPPAPFVMPPPPTGGGTLIGYVMGTDTIIPGHPSAIAGPLGQLVKPVCYGVIVRRSSTEVVVALRGTDGFAEWFEDAEFPPVTYGSAGALVEQGFFGIYDSLQLADLHGTLLGRVAAQLPGRLGPDDTVAVSGHSLGAPLATYLTLDLVLGPLAQRVSGCFFASPHPGNQAFADFFDSKVRDYALFNYVLDLVPRVPPTELGYVSLPKKFVITPENSKAEISFGIGCNHHVVCYLAMLDFDTTMAALNPVPAGEEGSASCIKGPHIGQPTLAKSLVNRIIEVANQ